MIAKKIGISVLELKYFEVGGVLDAAYEYVKDAGDGEHRATQSDFDSF